MPETIRIDIPRLGVGSDLTEALAVHGLLAEVVDRDDACELHITWADERERLVIGAIHAIEGYLADRALPLVVQRADGGAVVRPPGE